MFKLCWFDLLMYALMVLLAGAVLQAKLELFPA